MCRRTLLALSAAGAVYAFQFGLSVGPTNAQSAAALTGKVSSDAEPEMEGVVVSAKKDGSTITVSVITDDKGRYTFPTDRLAPGRYASAFVRRAMTSMRRRVPPYRQRRQ